MIEVPKKILLASVFLSLTPCVNSQSVRSFIHLGSNINFVAISNTLENKPGIGIDGAVSFEKALNNFSLETGVHYSTITGIVKRYIVYPNGSQIDPPILSERFRIHLLKLPFTINLKRKLTYGAGFNLRYFIQSNRHVTSEDLAEKYSQRIKIIKKDKSRIGLAAHGLIGRDLRLNTQTLKVKIAYEADLSSWEYPSNFDVEEKTTYSLRNHSVSLVVCFPLDL